MGRMLYRNGTNLLECLHLALVEQQKVTSELKANNDALARKIEPSELIGDEKSLPPTNVGEKIEYTIGVTNLN